MIPVLYDKDEQEFTSGGIGMLTDCATCTVTEERNGIYECEFSYPCTGPIFHLIREGCYIYATHDDSDDGQPFEIYARSEPIDGVVTFYAHHISYKLSESVVLPFAANSCKDAVAKLPEHIVGGEGFTFYTDKNSQAPYVLEVPQAVREMLGGEEGSLLDIYGGELKFDKFAVSLLGRRGKDTDIEIRYSKNLISYEHELDMTDTYGAVVPYYYTEGDDETPATLVMLPEKVIYGRAATDKIAPMDLTDKFENGAPTVGQLRTAAMAELETTRPWTGTESFDISFAALWQTEEYKDFAPLQRVSLCDTVLVYFPAYGVDAIREKVVKTVYNTLLNRFDDLTLGSLPATFAGTIT